MSEEYPVTEISPNAAVAPPVMLSIAEPSDETLNPEIWSNESIAPEVICSIEPPKSEDEIPLDPKELIAVSTSSLDAFPISEELRPASSRLETDVVAIFF